MTEAVRPAVRNATLDMHCESKRRERDENERRDGNEEVNRALLSIFEDATPSQRQSGLMSRAKDGRDINISAKDVMTISEFNERLDEALAGSDKDLTGDDIGELLWELAMKIRIQASEAVEAGTPLFLNVRIRMSKIDTLCDYSYSSSSIYIYIYIYIWKYTQHTPCFACISNLSPQRSCRPSLPTDADTSERTRVLQTQSTNRC